MTQCSWMEGHLKVSVSWSPGPCQLQLLSYPPTEESSHHLSNILGVIRDINWVPQEDPRQRGSYRQQQS